MNVIVAESECGVVLTSKVREFARTRKLVQYTLSAKGKFADKIFFVEALAVAAFNRETGRYSSSDLQRTSGLAETT